MIYNNCYHCVKYLTLLYFWGAERCSSTVIVIIIVWGCVICARVCSVWAVWGRVLIRLTGEGGAPMTWWLSPGNDKTSSSVSPTHDPSIQVSIHNCSYSLCQNLSHCVILCDTVSCCVILTTGDVTCDLPIDPDNEQQYIVWAVGGLGNTAFKHFARASGKSVS